MKIIVALISVGILGCGSNPAGSLDPEKTSTPQDPAPSAAAPDASGQAADAAPDAAATAPPSAKPTTSVLLIPGTTIPGSYFDTMAARLEHDGFSPVVFDPPDMFAGSLADDAKLIGDAVDARIAITGESRVDIVAECDGGVSTRYWLTMLGGASRVDHVVTFVSAHHGTWESPLGSWIPGFQALADITPGSDFMNTLNGAPFPSGLDLTSIYSCNDELMVPYDTSVVQGATNVLFCTHYLDHFGGFTDPTVYARILASLRGQGATAPTEY